jgi:hypothetical protein
MIPEIWITMVGTLRGEGCLRLPVARRLLRSTDPLWPVGAVRGDLVEVFAES